MSSILGFLQRNYTTLYPPRPTKSDTAIRIGLLGASQIAPIAVINPARSQPDVIIAAVAARDVARARTYATKYDIPVVHESYESLLADPSIDAVYIAAPNGLHYDWACKAIDAGKAVLLEKPLTSNHAEAVKLFNHVDDKNGTLLEAWHWTFHPVARQVWNLIHEDKVIGTPTHGYARLRAPKGVMGLDDIRFNYDLAGGACMDMGCYTVAALRYFLDAEVSKVTASNTFTTSDKRVDKSLNARLLFTNGSTGEILCNLLTPLLEFFSAPTPLVVIESETHRLEYMNFAAPSIYHRVKITDLATGKSTSKCYYPAESWKSTYWYQLDSFVKGLKGDRSGWYTAKNSIGNMHALDMIYEASGLGIRG